MDNSEDDRDLNDLCDQNESVEMNLGAEDDDDGKYNKISNLTADEILGLDFDSDQEAYDFYCEYARWHGFIVRKDDVTRDDNEKVIMRQFVCNREGFSNKKQSTRPNARTNCQARLRVRYSLKASRWKVKCFEEVHNHELAPSRYTHLVACRGMKEADKAQPDSSNDDVRTGYIMGYTVAQKGASVGFRFSKKNLYNGFNSKIRGEIKDGDVVAALSYLSGKASNDPMLYAKFTTTGDGRLKLLFWADGCSISDFLCFHDVLAIDMTHEKNSYNCPLVIFSGCNHHSQTIIFGCALVSDETIETYKWVLKSFLEAMRNKHPKVVVTNGDEVMMEAIKHAFPDSCHQLCVWNLHKNACKNVESSSFPEDFKKAIYSNFTPKEFEDFWIKMVAGHKIVGNEWVSKTFENRSLWATAYLRDKLFGRVQTTCHCETIDSIIKKYIRKKSSVFEFMHDFEETLRKHRNDELMADNKSLFSEPVLTTPLPEFEKDAAKIYTAELFKEVKEQILLAGALNVIERMVNEKKVIFKITKYCHPSIETKVVYDTSKSAFYCVCRHFESRGIPCSHIFRAMIFEHVDHIPSSLILTRWTKNAKIALLSSNSMDGIDYDVMEFAQFAADAAFTRLWQVALKNKEHYNEIMDDILKLTNKYKKMNALVDTQSSSSEHIGDPSIDETKGTPKNKKIGTKRASHSSNCNSTKDNVKTCSMHVCLNDKIMNDDQFSHPESSKFSTATDSDKEILVSDVNLQDKEILASDVNDGRDTQDKFSECCNQKQKKAKELTQKSKNDGAGYSSGGHHVNSKMQFILPKMQSSPYGYVPPSHGWWNLPYYSGVPILPQVPQYYNGVPFSNSDTPQMGLLPEATKNSGQTSGNGVQP
ncbi:protein FAR-RED IMPAIRED RESPONSE 1-like isoform X2 [Trifolium pratense]|nr:protein FAR-RED IMPAIRED RESPONSE 1-like isoform X2 [Trifolium pratense]